MDKTQTLVKMRYLELAAHPPSANRRSMDWHRGVEVLMLYWEKQRMYKALEEKHNLKR